MQAIEVSFDKNARGQALWGLLALVGVVLLVALALLGRAVTPEPARALNWQDWRARKLERAYRAELGQLRDAGEQLAEALQAAPDPIRVGLLHDRLVQRHSDGMAALAQERAALLDANQAVYAWALGAAGEEEAQDVLKAALEVLADDSR